MRRKRLDRCWHRVDGLVVHSRALAPGDRSSTAGDLVLLHGLGLSGRYMRPLLRQLAVRYRVWAPDLPGVGPSPSPPRSLDLTDGARILARWMEVVGLDRPDLVAHSAGCLVARELAVWRPELLHRLVLLSPGPDPSRGGGWRQATRLILDGLQEPPSLLALAVLGFIRTGPQRILRSFLEALRANRTEQAHLTAQPEACPGGVADITRSTGLAQVPHPTLLVRGRRDPLVSDRWIATLSAGIPQATVVTHPTAGHAVNYSHPDQVARTIHTFLQACTADEPHDCGQRL